MIMSVQTALKPIASFATAMVLSACACPTPVAPGEPPHASTAENARQVKVMVVNMFSGEAQPFIDQLGMTRSITVPGLSPDYPNVHCNADEVCEITLGMGYANAASSVAALLYQGNFDLTHAYFLIAGIAGIDPERGTIGSVAWARYLVDDGLVHEIDAREMPSNWPYGYLGINTHAPGEKPPLDYRTEVYALNAKLLHKAYALTAQVMLSDSPTAISFRAHYPYPPANQPPHVIQCDSASSDTWWAGSILTRQARDRVRLMTDGHGVFCTTQQEDNATFEALKRGAAAGKLDLNRVAVMRAGSDFSMPYPGQSAADGLIGYGQQGGFGPATGNLVKTARPLINAIVTDWRQWRAGVPD
jgi:purine nucleoside permease